MTNGKLVMHPSQALETWWDCTNPMPELAGLHAVTARLLALPETLTTAEQRTFWQRPDAEAPAAADPRGRRQSACSPRPTQFANKRNIENPELYAVFPFRLVAVGRPDIELGIEALRHRWDRGHFGWRQDDIFMAYLGLADEARTNLVAPRPQTRHGLTLPGLLGSQLRLGSRPGPRRRPDEGAAVDGHADGWRQDLPAARLAGGLGRFVQTACSAENGCGRDLPGRADRVVARLARIPPQRCGGDGRRAAAGSWETDSPMRRAHGGLRRRVTHETSSWGSGAAGGRGQESRLVSMAITSSGCHGGMGGLLTNDLALCGLRIPKSTRVL